MKKNLINNIENLDKNTFLDIPLGNMHETSITDNLLTTIIKSGGTFIQYDSSYKETGKKTSKTGTAADYILIIKDKHGKIHNLAFQAKVGKVFKVNNNKIGNFYKELDHNINSSNKYKALKKSNTYIKIKRPDRYQVDVFDNFLKKNLNFKGYYIFYNGAFTDSEYINFNNTKALKNKSFWIYPQSEVKKIMKNKSKSTSKKYKSFCIDDILHDTNHKSFSTFLDKY